MRSHTARRHARLSTLIAGVGLLTGLALGAPPHLGSADPARAQARGPGRASAGPPVARRYLVQLTRPPLARYPGTVPGLPAPPRSPRGRLLVDSPEARAYLALLRADQRRFEAALARALPRARVHWRYRILFNGLAVATTAEARPVLARLPGVARVYTTDRQWFRPLLDASLPLIGAPTFWQQVGGPANAGRGIKVAVVDTGIDPDNPFFDDPTLAFPAGFPKGATGHATPKVIAARAYFRPDDPVDTSRDEPNPQDHLGHGSHVAGTIAGMAGTLFDLGGYQAPVSGVAPKAYLMNYKVFYRAESGEEGAHEPELMAAFEDAVRDGADVISNSWGGPDVFGAQDPSVQAYEAAVAAGVVVVFAAGNEGPGDGSVASPGSVGPFITVGNTAVGRAFTRYLEVTAPAPVDPGLAAVRMVVGRISAPFSEDVGPAPLRSAHLAAGGTSPRACAPFPPGTFAGAIALVERGDCLFTEKAVHVADASAVALIVWNDDPTEGPFRMSGDDAPIPAVMVSHADGLALQAWVEAHPDAEAALRQGYVPYATGSPDQVVSSSSRGPTAAARLKPDLAAPGTPILSADAHRVGSSSTRPWDWKSGTSMATPHVAGAAALLLQRYPTWGPTELKSALVGTALRSGVTSAIEQGPARPWEMGAGRLDVAALLDVRFLATPAVLDGLELAPGQRHHRTLALRRNPVEITQVTVRWERVGPDDGLTLSPPDGTVLSLDAEGRAQVSVTAEASEAALPGDHTGWLVLADDQGGTTTVPYHVRVAPAEPARDLLIVDLSFAEENERPDVVPLYGQVAEAAGLDWAAADLGPLYRAPPLPELLRYRAVLAVTGDDRWNQYGTEARWSLDHLASYLAHGGRLILAGQGPLRDAAHDRFVALAGGATLEGRPLWDEDLGELRPLPAYRVLVSDTPHLVTAGITLDASALLGDLGGVGEIAAVANQRGVTPWGHGVLRLADGVFEGDGTVGFVYDPFPLWGRDALAEAHRHRAVLLGFGLEVMADPDPSPGDPDPAPGSRAELLLRAWQWVADRVTLSVTYETHGRRLILHPVATADPGTVAAFEVSFGDSAATDPGADAGAGPAPDAGAAPDPDPAGPDGFAVFTNVPIAHEYPTYGPREVTVIARSESGAAALWRAVVDLQPAPDADGGAGDGGVTADASSDATDIRTAPSGCQCAAAGDPSDGPWLRGPGGGRHLPGGVLFGLLALLWVARRRLAHGPRPCLAAGRGRRDGAAAPRSTAPPIGAAAGAVATAATLLAVVAGTASCTSRGSRTPPRKEQALAYTNQLATLNEQAVSGLKAYSALKQQKPPAAPKALAAARARVRADVARARAAFAKLAVPFPQASRLHSAFGAYLEAWADFVEQGLIIDAMKEASPRPLPKDIQAQRARVKQSIKRWQDARGALRREQEAFAKAFGLVRIAPPSP